MGRRAVDQGGWEPCEQHVALVRRAGEAFALALPDMLAPSRIRRVVLARAAAAWALRCRTDLKLWQIARCLGRTDHSTAANAIRMAEYYRCRDMVFHALTETLAKTRPIPRRRILPVVPRPLIEAVERRAAAARQREHDEWAALCRRECSPSPCELNGREVISNAELERRRGEGERRRAEHVAYWLAREAERYGSACSGPQAPGGSHPRSLARPDRPARIRACGALRREARCE